ncbi:peptide chain release factor aRF-1 [Desulfurococcus mucosus]|uniref:Peptide chain release factor subunit 1 n=1 Tax=Desulfurococcus mucosus (strain ATCC 35584 / DSM 2162 / JCM 9187 / O7/1) TaxID=765177 RepID=E8RA00_DESM0|nr:peptide chain release factor aRF-1 [Desulfurococcus mucosus]ADV65326.1 peptide chain release factor subunit 1 (aeRF-1) [Desulfurococcus mucosus DSM 2162]
MDKQRLREILKELKKWKAHATILLSLYIPPGRPISDVLNLLRQELSVADNIKLKKTRNAVERALSVAIERVSKIPKVPDKGLVLFTGENPDTGESITVMLIPPEDVPVFFYRTDKVFHTEFLEDMVSESNMVGLLIVERDAATIGLLKGNRLQVVEELEDYIPGKHQKGGQSQRRYDRIIEQMVEDFYKRVGEHVNKAFLPLLEQGKLKAILVGGPAYAKYDFMEKDYMDYRLKKIVLPEFIDVAYQGEPGLREMILKAGDALKEQEYAETLKALEEFKYHLAKDDGMIVYGDEEVRNALEMGLVETLLIGESREDVEEWLDLARKRGAKPLVLSDDIPEGEWFTKTFNGLAGILRTRITW